RRNTTATGLSDNNAAAHSQGSRSSLPTQRQAKITNKTMATILRTCTARARLVGSSAPETLLTRRKIQRLIPGLRNPALHGIPNHGKEPARAAARVCWKVHASSALNSISFTQMRRKPAPRTSAANRQASQNRFAAKLDPH